MIKYGIKYIQHALWTHSWATLTSRGYETWLVNNRPGINGPAIPPHGLVEDINVVFAFIDINAAFTFVSKQATGLWSGSDHTAQGFYYVVEEMP